MSKQARAVGPALPGSKLSAWLKRFEKILPDINNFAAVVAVCSGADAKVIGIIWGSLKVVFKVTIPGSHKRSHKTNVII